MAQWVKDTEAAGVAAGTRIPSLAQEFTHALGMVCMGSSPGFIF